MLALVIILAVFSFLQMGIVCNFIGRQLLEGKLNADNTELSFIHICYSGWPYMSGWLWDNRVASSCLKIYRNLP